MIDDNILELMKELIKNEKRNSKSWAAYTRMKSKVENIGLTPAQYEKAIRFIANYLGV